MVESQPNHVIDVSDDQVDQFGRLVADFVYQRWCSGSIAPLWSEVFRTSAIANFAATHGVTALRTDLEVLMRRASGRGWLVHTEKKRSLRVGPTYVASTRNTVRLRQPDDIGWRVADAVRRFRYKHSHQPTIKEIADFIRNSHVQRIFRREADLLKSLPWLVVAGWVRLEEDRVHRGPTALAAGKRRADQVRSARTGSPEHSIGEGAEEPIDTAKPPMETRVPILV